MKMTFRQKITLGQFFLVFCFLAFAITILINIAEIKNHTLNGFDTQFNHYHNGQDIKMDVVQIQQYLSDISATRGLNGLDNGLKEAEKSYQDLLKDIEDEKKLALKNNETEIINALEQIKVAAEIYYRTGVKMTNLYIKEGPVAGNAIMPEFDKTAKTLQAAMTPIQTKITNNFHNQIIAATNKVTFIYNLTIWLPILVIVIFCVFSIYFIKHLNKNFQLIVKGLVENYSDLESVSFFMYEESARLSQSTREQARAVENSASATHEISATISSNADYAKMAKDATERGVDVTKNGIETLNNVLKTIEDLSQNSMEVIKEMQASVKEVAQVIEVIIEIENKTKIINDIVFQTKLLAFNASVEAARAGEHGRGFAVVAEEVGNLSNMSGQAAKEISELLNNGVSRIKKIIDESTFKSEQLKITGDQKTQTSMQVVTDSKIVLDNILTNVENIKTMINEIAIASTQQSIGVDNVGTSFSQIEISIRKNSQIAEGTAIQSDILKQQTGKITNVVNDFLSFIEGDEHEITTFEWSERYYTGVNTYDEEHKILISKMNDFLKILNSKNLQQIKYCFNELATYTIQHFDHEEKFMESINYPELIEHKKIHKELITNVMTYGEELNKGNFNRHAIAIFLKKWLAFHIIGQDKKYGRYIS